MSNFKSIDREYIGEFKSKGSRFIGFIFPIKDIFDFEEKMKEIKSLHPKSRHFCYAYILGDKSEQFRFNDDGEPSGTAGRPIYNQLIKENLTYVGCIVIRYFGGILLGTAGLIKAYRGATQEALQNAAIFEHQICSVIKFEMQFLQSMKAVDWLKKKNFHIELMDFKETSIIQVKIPEGDVVNVLISIKAIAGDLHREEAENEKIIVEGYKFEIL